MAARHGLRVAEVDLGACRSRSPECQPAELQSRRGGLGALSDQFERKFAIFGFRIVVEDLKPIDDGPNWTDEIVTNPRAQQGRQFEGVRGGTGRWGARHKVFLQIRGTARTSRESRALPGSMHCGGACSQQIKELKLKNKQPISPAYE